MIIETYPNNSGVANLAMVILDINKKIRLVIFDKNKKNILYE